LRDLRLGDPVAENEEDSLSAYFLETASFREVLADRATVFVGRKGSGKTANLLQAAERLRADHRNLVCIVKPVWYEWESLLRLLTEYERRDSKGYMVQSLWKLLVYSEVAGQAAQELLRRPLSVPRTDDEEDFLEFVEGRGSFVLDEFAVRLEHAVGALLTFRQRPGSLSREWRYPKPFMTARSATSVSILGASSANAGGWQSWLTIWTRVGKAASTSGRWRPSYWAY